MPLGDRTRKGIEGWFTSRPAEGAPTWGDRLSDWGAGLIDKGSRKLMDTMEPPLKDIIREPVEELKANPNLPASVRSMLEKGTGGTHFVEIIVYILLAPLILIPLVSSAFQPVGNLIRYAQEKLVRSYRFDPISFMTLKRRFPSELSNYQEDLETQGWTDERIRLLELITRYYPSPADLVRWQAREVFEPDMVEKYGLDDELGGVEREPFYKAGMDDEQIRNHWRAHWEHASWMDVREMLRRGLITEQDVWEWFKVVEIVPYWREFLIATSWEVPTRVDVRRFWDMGTIDEARLREIYTAQGYHGKDLDDYVLWTKVYVAFPDLVARYKNLWLTLDEVRSELVRLGMTDQRAGELLETKFKADEVERTAAERTRTRTDVIKGVKEGVITREEAVGLLVELKYSADEARFILDVNIPVDEEDQTVALRQLTKSDIQKALKTEQITEDEARERLLELRYSPSDVELLLSIFRAANEPPEEEDERELTKTDIIKGVKKGVLTQEEAYLLLQGLGYSPQDAEFILEVETVESPFSPRNLQEFQERTAQWRRTVGADRTPSDVELREAANELLQITREVKVLREAVAEEERNIVDIETAPDTTTAKLKGMQLALHQAEAEQQRRQLKYDELVALKKWSMP